ncbi:MAG TPA: ZPR1 zinc finger domain-containing protein [Thermoprotei archaeon]|nr:ZPR1 zinc finger domain-containing protein [Thermoprotei archaeon]
MDFDLDEEGKIWDLKVKCPRCNEEYVISEYIYNIPLLGKVILSRGLCNGCGYRYNDVRAAESAGPQRIKLYIDEPEDLNILVIRAASASIYIPELGVSIEPGPASEGFITTVEGILDRVLKIMGMLYSDDSIDKDAWMDVYNAILDAKNGGKAFTLIINDPDGISRIISDKVEKERLYQD